MTTVALIGGTGLVGQEVARRLWANGSVAVTSFVRHEPKTRYERQLNFEQLLHDGGAALGLEEVDVAISCLGTTMKQAGSRGKFRRVDFDYVLAFAKSAQRQGARHFILVSSVGAKRSSGSYYLSVKAEIETAIARLGFDRVDVIRPGLLLGDRRELRLGERIAAMFLPIVTPFLRGGLRRYRASRVDIVARAIVALTAARAPGRYRHENSELDLLGFG